jgi:hypothetical protein
MVEFCGYILFFFLFYKINSNVVLLAAIKYKCKDNKIERAIKGAEITTIIVTGYQIIKGKSSFS